MITEEWRPVVGYEGRYDVSNLGRVRSWVANRGETLPHVLRDAPTALGGYRQVALATAGRLRSRRVHILVMAAFVGPCPDGEEVRHLNGGPADNSLTNLAYGTPAQNQADSIAHGTHAAASKTHCPQNHPYDEDNTYVSPRGTRNCKECRRAASRRAYHRAKESAR